MLWMAVVEKAAAGGGRRAARLERPWEGSWRDGRSAHFQQLAEAIAGVRTVADTGRDERRFEG